MSIPIEELTPRQIVAELDRYIVGQDATKKAVAVALRNRYRRQQLPPAERDDIVPKNILMIGPTGVGKTEIARRLAQLAKAPFIKVEATKFTEVGYVGRDVESMIRDLVAGAVRLVEQERMDAARPAAERQALDRLVELLEESRPKKRKKRKTPAELDNPIVRQAFEMFGKAMHDEYPDSDSTSEDTEDESPAERKKRKAALRRQIVSGKLDDREVEVEIDEPGGNPFVQVFTPQGLEEMGLDLINQAGSMSGRRSYRTMKVSEALEILVDQEARKLIDTGSVHREAVHRTEQTGIIFLDEIDKVAAKTGGAGPDVSREGVQRDLLPIIEGSTVATKFGPVKTDHILFIAAGAFHMSKPSDLIPELQGRLPIRVELDNLSEADFRKILHQPKNALSKQYVQLLAVDGVDLEFKPAALDEIAKIAAEVNLKVENIGARRLHTVMEKLLSNLLFEAPDASRRKVVVDVEFVQTQLAELAQDADLSRYIL
ncbi:MAG: ATP-dependent protease ATPase subunit ClpY [Fimbriimonadaceae bacterium]|nr:ATP-dependent protease ATPase subunit ClpY [Fimbriimonadaceae bacterium]